ncbi:DUF624 domain-containing protein [Jeotgalibacillus proteolyticus]|uniref:DUF624 domain-containing protein n=1 Tax=Jeotgalibacillus proteolyticus TaxID=2082395 RepID=A0A2S5GDI8_9BACL|nr:DUF624 domain-containing protein [Jeotgalibacillus proteolyticus]PPA71018.1 hypothetical protein C4B60_09570 [Jeotgalibacillus proteolyticus]
MKQGFLGVMEMFASFVLLNVMFFVYSLALITFIPALAATIETLHSWKKKGLNPYFAKSFHQSFKKHANTTALSLSGLWAAGLLILAADIWLVTAIDMKFSDTILAAASIAFIVWLMMLPYMTVHVMKVELKFLPILKNSFLLLWIEWKRTVLLFFMFVIGAAGILTMPFLLLISGSLLAISVYSIFMPMLAAYYVSPHSGEALK